MRASVGILCLLLGGCGAETVGGGGDTGGDDSGGVDGGDGGGVDGGDAGGGADGGGGGGDAGGGDDGGGDAGGGDGGGGDGGGGDGGGGDGGGGTAVEPDLGGTSGGDGGRDQPSGGVASADGVSYQLLAPTGADAGHGVPLLLVISGTEGSSTMMANMRQVAPYYDLEDALIAVLDGRSASAGDAAAVLDALRAAYDVDNDRTWLLSESAGTAAGLELGLALRPSWFAAVWFNDVNARGTPTWTTAELGVAPWGNAGPGGNQADAEAIVAGLRAAGYQLPADAPYSGAGAETHGSTQQFLAAVSFFADKVRAEAR